MATGSSSAVQPLLILPDPYWASMILGRLVHLHLTLVEYQLFLEHRDVEARLLAEQRAAWQTVGVFDGTRPVDRVWARIWLTVLGQPLPETIAVPDTFVRHTVTGAGSLNGLELLVFDPERCGVEAGLARALRDIDDHGLSQIVRLGVGLVGVDALGGAFEPVGARECVLLPPGDWSQATAVLSERVLAEAARALAVLWAAAEVRAYALDVVPSSVGQLAADFAVGVVADYRRRSLEATGVPRSRESRPAGAGRAPAQDEALPLLSELVRCWWPQPGRARNIFGSQFDYMSTLEVDRAHH